MSKCKELLLALVVPLAITGAALGQEVVAGLDLLETDSSQTTWSTRGSCGGRPIPCQQGRGLYYGTGAYGRRGYDGLEAWPMLAVLP